MKNLENYGVLEMNAKEISETDGGFVLSLLGIAIVAGLIISAIDNTEDIINGATDGWNAY